jgi:AcrR family transcriptional regulator
MPTKKIRRAEGRPRLNRDLILETAVRLADEAGIGKLSMRRLGEELGVEAMSLYNYVANKEGLLNGMIDALYGEIELPSHDDDWKTAVRKRSVSVRAVLLRHPWANGLMDSATQAGPCTLRHHDRVLGTFRNGGFSLAMTAHAFSAVDSYVYGYAKQEKALPFNSGEEAAAMANVMLAQLPPSEYPYLHELMAKHVLQPGYSYADEFTFGLDLVLDALARAKDSEG